MRIVMFLILLATMWVALLERINVYSFLSGLLLGGALLIVVWPSWPREYFLRHGFSPRQVLDLANYLYHLWRELILSSLTVAWIVLSFRRQLRPAILAIPTVTLGDLEDTLLANSITLLPGTLALDYSADRVRLYVHFLDIDSPDQARQTIRDQIERYIIKVL
jgi:multicomponent Na+:H+ antiporter subunit E